MSISRDATAVAMFEVDRAVAEYRRGGFVAIENGSSAALTQSVERATTESIEQIEHWCGSRAALALSGARARLLQPGPDGAEVVTWSTSAALRTASIRALVDPTVPAGTAAGPMAFEPADAESCSFAAVRLSKIARLLPAAVFAPYAKASGLDSFAANRNVVRVDVRAISDYDRLAALTLDRVSEARVPLEAAENTRMVAFRPADGSIEHYAIVIGEPERHQPALCRVHSACFTGDLLGSLRCDCGPQLKRALEQIGREGHGVVLYLAQEGRGIGLVNKLRAYDLQDQGLDTIDANRHLGYDADERNFRVAAVMLTQLGIAHIRLMTNNPAKVDALQHEGIEVSTRVPHAIRANGHNRHYLETKALRGGHLLDVEP